MGANGAGAWGQQEAVACSAPLNARGAIRPADWLRGSELLAEWVPRTENGCGKRVVRPLFCSPPLT